MAKYFTKSFVAIENPDGEFSSTADILIEDLDSYFPYDTGVLDQNGEPIYRAPDRIKIGYI